VTAIAVAVMKIFGNQGILLTFAVIAVLIAAIYLYQNKLLYMPGRSLLIQTFLGLHMLLKTTLLATGTHRSTRSRLLMLR